MTAHTPITMNTRWRDGKGRAWHVIENLYFGRYLCAQIARPSLTGEWTAKEIRAAIAKAKGESA